MSEDTTAKRAGRRRRTTRGGRRRSLRAPGVPLRESWQPGDDASVGESAGFEEAADGLIEADAELEPDFDAVATDEFGAVELELHDGIDDTGKTAEMHVHFPPPPDVPEDEKTKPRFRMQDRFESFDAESFEHHESDADELTNPRIRVAGLGAPSEHPPEPESRSSVVIAPSRIILDDSIGESPRASVIPARPSAPPRDSLPAGVGSSSSRPPPRLDRAPLSVPVPPPPAIPTLHAEGDGLPRAEPVAAAAAASVRGVSVPSGDAIASAAALGDADDAELFDVDEADTTGEHRPVRSPPPPPPPIERARAAPPVPPPAVPVPPIAAPVVAAPTVPAPTALATAVPAPPVPAPAAPALPAPAVPASAVPAPPVPAAAVPAPPAPAAALPAPAIPAAMAAAGPPAPALPAPGLPAPAAAASGAPATAKRPPPPPSAAKLEEDRQKRKQVRQWWERFFSDDYLVTVLPPTPAQIAKQIDFVEASLALPKGGTVLDVGCGLGLHAIELARRGYLVVAIDLSLAMITRAAEAAQQQNLKVSFIHADIREMEFDGAFDAAICLGTTFGFFDDEANRDVLLRMQHGLKPGGRLLLDVVNRDYVIRTQPNLVWFEGDECVCMEESEFNYFNSRLSVKRTMMREDGRQTNAEYSMRLYSLHELGQLVQTLGFRVIEVSGQEAIRGTFFGSNAPSILMLAERRASGPRPQGTMTHERGSAEMTRPSFAMSALERSAESPGRPSAAFPAEPPKTGKPE